MLSTPEFPNWLDYGIFIFSNTSTILGTQCSLEYISKYVDLERALFSYSVTCYLHE